MSSVVSRYYVNSIPDSLSEFEAFLFSKPMWHSCFLERDDNRNLFVTWVIIDGSNKIVATLDKMIPHECDIEDGEFCSFVDMETSGNLITFLRGEKAKSYRTMWGSCI
jgi:hypothetical protein